MSLPEHIYALTNHCLDIVKQAPSSVHVHVIVVIVIVVIIVVIVVVVIVVVGGHIDDSVDGYEEKAEEGGDREAGFNLFLACTSI